MKVSLRYFSHGLPDLTQANKKCSPDNARHCIDNINSFVHIHAEVLEKLSFLFRLSLVGLHLHPETFDEKYLRRPSSPYQRG